MLKEAHTISYIQQASHEWIERDEEEIAYAQVTESLKEVPTDIEHGPKVLQRFKVAHKPLVKALSSFESMESHGESIKPLLRQLITWTPPKEGITLLELFGGIGTGHKALLQSGMVVRRYFYVDIDPIARQVAASRMKEFTTRFPQQFATTAWKVSFTFLPSDIQLIQKKHMELLGPVDLIISGWECQEFSAVGFGEGLSDTRSGLFTDMVRLITWAESISPTFGYVIENTPWFPANIIGKLRGAWPTFVSFPGAHAFQGDGPSLVYRHASATWDEPSPEERERAMGFQAGTTNHIKVTRLERNALLRRGMDMNFLTWLLVTCVLFQMYTTPTLVQSTCNSSDATTWHPDQVHLPIFNTLHFTLSVGGGEEVPCNLTQVVSNTPGGASASGETITTFYESM
jgi:hypothetical protein